MQHFKMWKYAYASPIINTRIKYYILELNFENIFFQR